MTADRPADFVDIFDGQTIRQKNIFQQHSYGDFELLEDEKDGADDYNFETIKKAVELCIEKSGPVHINIPLTEPLYNLLDELPVMPAVEKTIQKKNYEVPSNLIADWNTSKRIMILAGTLSPNPELEAQLSQLVKNHTVVVLTEMNSNLHHDKFFAHIDRYITDFSEEDYHTYAPDLLITIGQNVVSKRVKQFLRKAKPKQHWHIDEYWQPDTYFVLSQKIETKPEVFFSKLLKSINLEPRAYFNLWDVLKDKKMQSTRNISTKHHFRIFIFSINYPIKFLKITGFISPILRQSDMHNYLNIRNMMCIATAEPAGLTDVLLRQWDLQ